jgi:hypothetical protein
MEFTPPAGTARPARRFDWRLQDVGSPQFQLEVSGLDALIDTPKSAGYRFLSVVARAHSTRSGGSCSRLIRMPCSWSSSSRPRPHGERATELPRRRGR